MKRRLMAVLMACVMTLSLLPISALATENSVKYGYYEHGSWVEGTVNQTLPEGVQSINKTARPTNNPNEYEIELEVIMEQTTETTPPGSAATVLVIDCSNSMEGKRLKAAKVAAISFMKAYSGLKNFDNNGSTVDTEDLNLGRYVSVVWFATTGGIQQDWVDVSNPANYNAAVEMINRLRIDGGTNLDAGLRLASVQLDATAVSQISYRNVIALTDGEPTYYLTADESGNPSINIGGTLYTVRGSGRSCDYDTFQKTKESANVLKEKTTLYTVCFGASKDKITDYDRPEYFLWEYYPEKITVGDYLKTKIATSDKTAYNADSADELYEVFAAISTSITTGLKSGVVTDTLPIGVSADGRFSPEWELKGAVGVEDGNKTVYTYTKTYKVTVDPKKVTVNEDNYTPLNGVTTLRVGENTQVYFPIPAVKVLITDPVVVTIKGNANRVEYDGNSHSVTGYTVESITCNGAPYAGYTESDFEFTGTASITGTDAKTYNMGLEESYFTNTSSIFANVTFIVEDGYLEITPKPVTITVDSAEKSFGENDPAFTGKVEGLIDENDLGTISYSRTNKDEAVGTYEKVLDATYAANSNYTVKVVKGDFTIKTATSDAALSAAGGEWEYDGTAHAASAMVSDETFTIYYKVGDGEWTTTAPSVTNVSDGPVTVSVKATKDGYNDLTCDNVTLKITPRPATITVGSAEKTFGAPDPAFTGKVEGLIGENDLGKISYSRTNTDEAVGTYEGVLDATYTENKNYSVTVVKGNFTIKTATSDAVLSAAGGEWEYDGTAHAARATVSDETFTIYYKAGDGEWTTTAPSVTNVSDGLVTVSVKATKEGYNDLTCDDVTLKITPKPVTITVGSAEKTFGEKDPAFTGKVEGLIDENDLGKISYSRTNKDEAVGTYEGVLDATYTENKNYSVTVVKGNFTIKTAASDAVLSAAGGEWEYDGTAHAASATVSDETFTIYYKAGDGEWTTTAPSVTNVSDGLVTVSVKATKEGYNDLTCDDVTLKITPKPVTITVGSAEKTFGEKDPAFTGKVEGLIDENDLGKISYSRTNKDEAVGTYEGVLDATYTENKNYSVTVVKGNFTIKTATSDAVLSAAGGEWEYDGTAHAASATVSDETFTIYYKAGDGEWTTTAPSVTNVSDGLVTVSVKATKEGYNDLTCDDVTLKITPKPVTVTANDMYVFSGSPVPTYSAQVEGTINDDKITYTISCDYTEAAGAGEFFDIIPSGEAKQGNYVVTYVNGTLEVRQLPNLAFNLGQYIQKDLRIIGSRAFTGATYSATVTPVVNNELGKAMTITVSYGSGESGLKPFVGELGFTERGSYRYEVKEIIPSGATGYDTSVYYLTVDVGLNDDELVVDKVTKTLAGGSEDPSEGAIVFCNTYNTGTIYVPVVKPTLNRDDHYAYVVGYPDGMVRPSGNITRAEAATIFFRLLTDDSRNQFWMTTNAYSDVNRGDWFNNAVSTLSNAGIISGYPDGTFRPNAPITRAEMSKIIALFAKLNKSEDRFNDIAGHWAEAYIKLAAGNGWIAGYPDGSFKPQQNITRAETMTMINRVLERVPSVESHLLPYNAMLTFPDCQSGQWFYIAVQEATNSHTYERAASEKNGDEQWIALRANRDWTQFQN